MEVQWWDLCCNKIRVLIISLRKRKLVTKIEYFYLEDSEYINEEFFIKISVDLVTMAESLLIFNRQQKQRRNWSWMMMKDKVKIEGKNNKRKNPVYLLSGQNYYCYVISSLLGIQKRKLCDIFQRAILGDCRWFTVTSGRNYKMQFFYVEMFFCP